MAGIELRLPKPLDCSDLVKAWPKWKQSFKIYLMANDKMKESEESKIATFLWLVGQSGVEIFNALFPNDETFSVTFGEENEVNEVNEVNDGEDDDDSSTVNGEDDGRLTLEKVLKKFDGHCVPKRNPAMEAFKFNMILQKEKQPFAEFETALRTQIQYCEFTCTNPKCKASFADRMLRDRIIIGVHDKKLQLKLLESKNYPLSKIIDNCKIYEAAALNKQFLERKDALPLEVKTIATKNRSCYNCGQFFNGQHCSICPAVNAKCNLCGKLGHFKKWCRSMINEGNTGQYMNSKQVKMGNGTQEHQIKTGNGKQGYQTKTGDKQTFQTRAVRAINWNNYWGDSGNGDVFDLEQADNASRINSLRKIRSYGLRVNRISWKKRFLIQGWQVEFKLDSGSDANCIPIKYVQKMDVSIDNYDDGDVLDYNDNGIKIYGQVKLNCVDESKGINNSANFLIVDNDREPILGLEACVAFGLIKLVDSVNFKTFPDNKEEFLKQNVELFDGFGKFPGKSAIVLREGAVPSLRYKKRIPLSLCERLEGKLKQMVEGNIISFVDYPTDWVHNLQITEKPNKDIRICLDPKPLNVFIKREYFMVPTPDDILCSLSGKRVFSVFDLCNGFWHIELDKESSDLTTFMTPFGRFRWNRLPFGLSCAPEMFQRKMVQIFGDIPGVIIYFDDITVSGSSFEDHDKALNSLLERAKVNSVKFNSQKLQYRTTKIKIVGHIITDGKVEPEKKHIKAIIDMPKPRNKSDVLRLLALFKYLGKFIPNLSKRSSDLRELTRDKVEFKWSDIHDRQLNDLLQSITTSPVLVLFDPSLPVVVQTDSSKDGLGSVLLQNDRPVAYASRTLTKSEQRWSQLEKELLAVVFACKRFHFYLYGREFVVHSDHKPHQTLIDCDIDQVTPRLQRMYMQLLKYEGISIVFRPGKEMLVADCLSRAPLDDSNEFSEELSVMIHSLTRRACLSKENYELYVRLLNEDERYCRLIKYIETFWPSYHQLDDFSKMFYRYRDELHYENGLLFKDHRLIIPDKLQCNICKILHAPHLGIEKTLGRARMQYFWPGMTSAVTEVVKGCTVCDKFTRNNQKEPLIQEEPPNYPFHKLSVDIYEYAGSCHLSIIDAYSGYVISKYIDNKGIKDVIEALDQVFCCYGYPTELRSDNVPFNSYEFERYAQETNILLKFSSPKYPQSNGLAEKGVAIVKNILKRCYEADEVDQFQYRILEYNTTPVANMGLSPSQLFFSRLVKSRLPIDSQLLIRNNITNEEIQEKLKNKQVIQKHYYDRNAKNLPALNIGDRVRFKKNGQEWNYGNVVEDVNGRSWIVVDDFEKKFRRNRRFIVKSKNDEFDVVEKLLESRETDALDRDSFRSVGNKEVHGDFHDESLSLISPVSEDVFKTRSGRTVKPPKRYGFDN